MVIFTMNITFRVYTTDSYSVKVILCSFALSKTDVTTQQGVVSNILQYCIHREKGFFLTLHIHVVRL